MSRPPLLPRPTLVLVLAVLIGTGLDEAVGATATATRTPPAMAGPKAPPAQAPAEEAPPAEEEPETTDESATTDETGDVSASEEEVPVEAEPDADAEAQAEPEADPANETAPENDGEPTDAEAATPGPPPVDDHRPTRAATDRPPEPTGARGAGPAAPHVPNPAPPPTAAKERPSLLHHTPPPPGSPPPPPAKAEALPKPLRPVPDVRSPSAPVGVARSPASGSTPVATGDADPSRAPSVAAGERGLPSLAALTATRERPLFVVGRRGPEQRSAPVVTMEPAEPSQEVEPTDAPFTAVLGGVVSGPGIELAILVDPSTNAVSRVKRGEDHDGWTLAELDRRTATFRRGEERAVLKLKPPGSTVVPGVTGSDDEAPKPVGRKPGPRPRSSKPPEAETTETETTEVETTEE